MPRRFQIVTIYATVMSGSLLVDLEQIVDGRGLSFYVLYKFVQISHELTDFLRTSLLTPCKLLRIAYA